MIRECARRFSVQWRVDTMPTMKIQRYFRLLVQFGETKAPELLTIIVLLATPTACQDTEQTANTSGASKSTTSLHGSPWRIMPLGDSITHGDTTYASYRRPLWKALQTAGLNVDFVGSQQTNHGGNPPHVDFDTDHEGHWGWRTDEILQRIEQWAEIHKPDVFLVHLGSNDLFQGQSPQSTLAEMHAIIQAVRLSQPMSVFLIAQIIPTTDPGLNTRIEEMNAGLLTLAREMYTEASPIHLVDQSSGFDPSAHTYDGVHPNTEGEAVMAGRWFARLKALLLSTPKKP